MRGPSRPAAAPRTGGAGSWPARPRRRHGSGRRASGRWRPPSRRPSSGPSSIAPARTSTPHGASPPGIRTTSSSVPMPSSGDGRRIPGSRVDGLRRTRAPARTACARAGCERAAVVPGPSTSVARGTRPAGPPLPDPHERRAGRDPDPVGTPRRARDRARWGTSRPRRGRRGGRGRRVVSLRVRGARLAAGESRTAPPRARRAGSGASAALEEPLEVAQPVAPVPALVDAVEAEPARLAPGPHRVRVHAEDPRRLGDGQGGVTRVEGSWESVRDCGIW